MCPYWLRVHNITSSCHGSANLFFPLRPTFLINTRSPTGPRTIDQDINSETENHHGFTPANIKIGLINIRSIKNKVIDFQEMISDYSLDMVAVTETWLSGYDTVTPGNICPPNYKILHVPRHSGAGGGIALIYKKNFCVTQCNSSLQLKSMETMEVSLSIASKHYNVVIVYRPPPSQTNQLTNAVFKEEYPKLLESVILKHNKLLLVGDFNIHVDNPDDNLASFFIDTLSSFGLQQHVNKSTHKKSHILDLVITRGNENIDKLCVIDPDISDHYLVTFNLDVKLPKLEHEKITYRKLKTIDLNSFCKDLENSELNTTISDDVNYLAKLYDDTLEVLFEKHAPLKTKTVVVRDKVPWYNNIIGEARRNRRKLERKWKTDKTNTTYQAYKTSKNKVNTLISNAKNKYFTELIKDAHRDQKRLFEIINGLLHRTKARKLPAGDVSTLPEIFNNFL